MMMALAAAGVSPESPIAKVARNSVGLSDFMAHDGMVEAMKRLDMDPTDKEQADRFVSTVGGKALHYCKQQLLSRLREVVMEETANAGGYFVTVYTGMQVHGDLDRVIEDVISGAFRDMAGGTEGEQD